MYKHPNGCRKEATRTKGTSIVSETVRQRCRPNVVLDRYTVRWKKVWRRIYTNRTMVAAAGRGLSGGVHLALSS